MCVHFMSEKMDWETPQGLYEQLDKEFHFDLDPCATVDNAKCPQYFTQKEDGLVQDWGGGRAFMNPPYGREIGKWMKKAYEESLKKGFGGVPSSVENRYKMVARLLYAGGSPLHQRKVGF